MNCCIKDVLPKWRAGSVSDRRLELNPPQTPGAYAPGSGPCTVLVLLAILSLGCSLARAEEVGDRWGTEEREREYYPIVNLPIPKELVIEAGAFCVLPDGRVAVGTR